MQILTGTIEKIVSENGFSKKEVTLKMEDKQTAFIEFRGPVMVKLLDDVQVNDTVQIPVFFNGRISQNSGQKYNNLVAKSIKKLELVSQ